MASNDKYIKIIVTLNNGFNESIKLCKIESKTPLSYMIKTFNIEVVYLILFNGDFIDIENTPETLGLKDDCVIDVFY